MREYIEEDLGEGRVLRTYSDGTKCWYKNDKFHREDGPAIEYTNGTKCWYKNGKCHREDGPAKKYYNGDKFWYNNAKLHREDGPAVEYADRDKQYWLFNKRYDSLPSPEEIEIIKKEMIIGGVIL